MKKIKLILILFGCRMFQLMVYVRSPGEIRVLILSVLIFA